MAAALSMALCYINRVSSEHVATHVAARIVVISVSPDAQVQYIPTMNCIFSAQKAVRKRKEGRRGRDEGYINISRDAMCSRDN